MEQTIGSINKGLIYQLSRYNKSEYLESTIRSSDNLGFLTIQARFNNNNIYCYSITIYMLCENGSEKDLILEKENMVKEVKSFIKCDENENLLHNHHKHNEKDEIKPHNHFEDVEPIKIAIIGSGIGGSSCSYYINEEFLADKIHKPIEITVFEKEKIGGRTRNIDIQGKYTELGGSVVHPLNENIIKLIKKVGLKIKKSDEVDNNNLVIWNGKEFVFSQHPYKIINQLKMLYNYNLSPIKFKNARDDVINKFLKGYNNSEPFKTVEEFYKNLGILEVIKATAKEHLCDKLGISTEFVEDILSAGMRVNYNQDYDNLSAFAAFIGLAGTDDGLFSVEGGNYQVSEALLKNSNAKVLSTHEVIEIEKVKKNKKQITYKVTSKDLSKNDELSTDEFDVVVISTPIEFSKIKFTGLPVTHDTLPKKDYKKVHVHLIGADSINGEYFGYPKDHPIDCILTAFNKTLPFFSLCENSRGKLDDGRQVFKIFAPNKLESKLIDKFFVKPELLHYHVWSAYPVLSPTQNFPPIIIDDGLFYNNAFEHSVSTIETTTISSKNTARLISNYLNNNQ
ncbi:hypothetical protein RB653_000050 [Dictyostelium firmibasis]|uniref:Prenylcysteine lyase domain-containing protein n=1 Tax=Dictyostelium firmibasis TaxID=79012 RepID=A0AAN7TW12_9MYCE